MKLKIILCAVSLAVSAVRAVKPASIMTTARNAAVAGLQTTKIVMENTQVKEHLQQAGKYTAANAGHAARWAAQNPGTAAACGLAGVGVVAAVAPAVFVTPALGVAGFGAKGVATGSIAAVVQSNIGNVIAGSAFATLQSAGAAGAGAAVVNGVVQVGGVGVALGSGGLAWMKSKL